MSDKILFAHFLRGIAALTVVCSHLLGAFWELPQIVPNITNSTHYTTHLPLVSKIFLLNGKLSCLDYGRFGVAIFFLISGFVIPFSLKKLTGFQFAIARFFRIWPTYWAGLFISVMSIFISSIYFNKPFSITLSMIVSHLFILRDIFWQLPSIDGISWTLEIEIKFYLLCALIRPYIVESNIEGIMKVVGYLLSFVIFVLITAKFVTPHYKAGEYFLYLIPLIQLDVIMVTFMLIGTIFFFLYEKKIENKKAILLISILFSLFAIQWHSSSLSLEDSRIFVFLLALLLFSIMYYYNDKIRVPKLFVKLADISYSLYVVHAILGYVVMRILFEFFDSPHLIILMAFMSVFFFTILINRFVEVPSNRLGKKLAFKLKTRLALVDQTI